jgi:hypothetical protein
MGIPKGWAFAFQLLALINLGYIWMARNDLIHEASSPDPSACLLAINIRVKVHLKAWKDSRVLPEN